MTCECVIHKMGPHYNDVSTLVNHVQRSWALLATALPRARLLNLCLMVFSMQASGSLKKTGFRGGVNTARSSRVGTSVVVSFLLVILFAGCVDPDTPADSDKIPEGSIAVQDPETGTTSFLRALSTANPDAAPQPIWIRDNWTDSFEATDFWANGHQFTAPAGLDAPSHQSLDITDLVPVGVPTWIMAEVDLPFTEGDVDLWISSSNDDTWTADFDTPRGGYSKVEIVMVNSGAEPIELNLFYDEREGTEGFEFTVLYEVFSSGEILMPGVPTTVEIPDGTRSLEVRYIADNEGDVSLWRFDDDFVGRFASADKVVNVTLDEGVRGGEYVVLTPADAGPARVTVYAPADASPPARPLELGTVTQNIMRTDEVPFAMNEGGEASLSLPTVPLQVGMRLFIERFVNEINVELAGPSGSIIKEQFTDTTPFMNTQPEGGMGFGFWTPLGAPGLEAGTYTATFVGGTNSAGSIRGMYVGYTR